MPDVVGPGSLGLGQTLGQRCADPPAQHVLLHGGLALEDRPLSFNEVLNQEALT